MYNIEHNQPIVDSNLPDQVTYGLFGLDARPRQAGLRKLNDIQMFSLAFMQRHCSIIHGHYYIYKPFIENEISESEMWVFFNFFVE